MANSNLLNKAVLSRSATFYRRKKPLSKTKIEACFKAASMKKIGRYECKEIKTSKRVESQDALVSFIVFKFKDEPSFLKGSNLEEEKYAFLLFIEVFNYLIVFKKSVSSFDKNLKGYIEKLGYEEIQYLFGDEDVFYEKLSSTAMSIATAGIQRRTIESNSLNGQVSTYSSRRSIPTSTTVRNEDSRHILRPNSSSVSKIDSKANIDNSLQWVKDICEKLNKGVKANEFLDRFAQPVKYSRELIYELKPSAITLNTSSIKDYLSEEGASLIFNNEIVSNDKSKEILDILDKTYYIFEEDSVFHIIDDLETFNSVGILKINVSSITTDFKFLKEISIDPENGEEFPLEKYINKKQLFSIAFECPEHLYIMKKVFKDRGVLSALDELLRTLIDFNFDGLSSEKGCILEKNTRFAPESVFNFVEKAYEDHNGALICDDLGDEWADYIYLDIEDPSIKLIHCKYGKRSTGASQFQEVIGQALKNIGRVSFSVTDIERKLGKWGDLYSGSLIKRLRSNHRVEDLIRMSDLILSSPTVNKEIIIVMPALSIAEIKVEFKKLKENERVDPHIIQLVWILSAFVFACKEQGVIPQIWCSE